MPHHNQHLQTKIRSDRQRYYDEPVYCNPLPDPVGRAVRQALREMHRGPVPHNDLEPQPVIVRYERVQLRWMVPDGKGGLKPRDT